MRAMIFAAGLGSRLGKITNDLPKCLVPVAGRAMLEHVVERLKTFGVDQVMINLHHHAEKVKKYVVDRGCFGIEVSFSFEEKLLNTGGGLKQAQEFFHDQEDFLIHNSDVFSDIDLNLLLQSRRDSGAVATLAVMRREADRQLVFDQSLKLVGWRKVSSGQSDLFETPYSPVYCGFAGIHAASSQLFEIINRQEGVFGIISSYLLAVRSGQLITGLPFDNSFWIDVGSPENLQELRDWCKLRNV